MRHPVAIASAAAVVAGAIARVALRRASFRDVPGNLPGEQGSKVNTWLNGPLHLLMAARLDPQPDDEVLDIACGDAAFLAEHGSRVRYVAGLDLYQLKVGLAQRRLADRIAAGTAQVVKGEAGALPWEDARFSAVTCMDAFPFFPDPERVVAEMCRVLRPGGRAVIEVGPRVPEATESHWTQAGMVPHWVWNEADVRRMTGAAGFDDVAIAYGRVGGDNRLGNLLARLYMGTDETRIVVAVKPVPVRPAGFARAEEAVAVG